jgi:protein translocase SecG subunit
MLQKNRGRGLDGSFGNAGSGFEGRRGQTTDMALSRWTKILGVAFVIVTIAANVIAIILK